MMRTLLKISIFSLALIVMFSCKESNGTAVPRRTAYPRIHMYDTIYNSVSDVPIFTVANSGVVLNTETRADGSIWLNIRYPDYNATVYCTYTPVDDASLAQTVENRMERMLLNIGAAPYHTYEIDNGTGYVSELLLAPSSMPTPVQFISSSINNPRWLFTGSAFIDGTNGASIDSVAPIVDVLERDIRYMLHNLR